jgi:hypothetical protein
LFIINMVAIAYLSLKPMFIHMYVGFYEQNVIYRRAKSKMF